MNRKILIAVGIAVALVLGVAVNDANAVCGNAKQFGQCDFVASGCFDLIWPGDANKAISGGVLKGRWWQTGSRASNNEGSGTGTPCNEVSWLTDDGSGGALRFSGYMNGYGGPDFDQLCEGVGCPGAPLVVLLQTLSNDGSKAYYAAGKANGTDQWDFSTNAASNWNVVEVPRPRVTGSGRSGLTVTVNLGYETGAPAGARGESESPAIAPETIVTGYQLMRYEGPSDPGRNPASWANLGSPVASSSSGATATGVGAVCTSNAQGNPNDVFIATRLIFDSGQYLGDYVSASTRIECDPFLADPRFKLIDKKKPTRAPVQAN